MTLPIGVGQHDAVRFIDLAVGELHHLDVHYRPKQEISQEHNLCHFPLQRLNERVQPEHIRFLPRDLQNAGVSIDVPALYTDELRDALELDLAFPLAFVR